MKGKMNYTRIKIYKRLYIKKSLLAKLIDKKSWGNLFQNKKVKDFKNIKNVLMVNSVKEISKYKNHKRVMSIRK